MKMRLMSPIVLAANILVKGDSVSKKTPKRPSFQFYPGDWLRDAGVRALSPTARSILIDSLCLMYDNQYHIGYLTINGEVLPKGTLLPILARILGYNLEEIERGMEEILYLNVLSTDDSGCIFSRRIIRDEEIRQARAAGGIQSVNHPNTHKPKGTLTPTLEGANKGTLQRVPLHPPFGVPPSSVSLSASSSPKESNPREKNLEPVDNFSNDNDFFRKKNFDVDLYLDDDDRHFENIHAPGWDKGLLRIDFNNWIKKPEQKVPKQPAKAYLEWLRKVKKGMPPP
jgi:hypothetical protein